MDRGRLKTLPQPGGSRPLSWPPQVPPLFASVLTVGVGDHSWQQQQPQEQQPRAAPWAGGAGAHSESHVTEMPTGDERTRAVGAEALQISDSETLGPVLSPLSVQSGSLRQRVTGCGAEAERR